MSERTKMNFVREMGANKNGTDEWYTPKEAIEPLLKYLKPHSKILCPFDTKESEYYKVLTKAGHSVTCTHIVNGQDFFKINIKSHFDYIISNPSYSKRDMVLNKLYDLKIPFAMIMNVNGLFDSRKRIELAKNKGCQIMYLYPRTKFIDSEGKRNSPPFQSCYWCYKILPNDLMFSIGD